MQTINLRKGVAGMLSLDQTFIEITKADVNGLASEEEYNMLRFDENLEEWKQTLLQLLTDTNALVNEREAALLDFKARGVGKQAYYQQVIDFKQFKAESRLYKGKIHKRLAECKRLLTALKQKRHIEHQQAQGQSRTKRQNDHIERVNEDRKRYRVRLNHVRSFLQAEDHFKPEYLPAVRHLLAEVEETLYPKEETSS